MNKIEDDEQTSVRLQLTNIITRTPINFLVGFPLTFSAVIFLTVFVLDTNGWISQPVVMFLSSLGFLVFGISGIPIIIKNERPTFFIKLSRENGWYITIHKAKYIK